MDALKYLDCRPVRVRSRHERNYARMLATILADAIEESLAVVEHVDLVDLQLAVAKAYQRRQDDPRAYLSLRDKLADQRRILRDRDQSREWLLRMDEAEPGAPMRPRVEHRGKQGRKPVLLTQHPIEAGWLINQLIALGLGLPAPDVCRTRLRAIWLLVDKGIDVRRMSPIEREQYLAEVA